ncbi:uncharacterized protein YihR-like [Corticium candelabrum]|uniref:uncharacterized protein YihR-like n=1 Tax=Corticium candelabrum TaxID=121492 RepID=UPI002E2690A4|nr:uncharacterized protein YihR-like [Corticium candelabrum]
MLLALVLQFAAIAASPSVSPVSAALESEESRCDRFEVVNDEFGDLHLKVLRNAQTNESVSIIYDFGGRIEEIQLRSKVTGKLKSVIWTHDRNATSVRENGSWRGQILLPYANRVNKGIYEFEETFYRLPIADFDRHHAMHGLIYNRTLTVVDQMAGDDGAVVILGYNFTGEDLGYPFLLEVIFTYSLRSEGFFFKVRARNVMERDPLPFQVGWHPYFLVSVVSEAIVTFDRSTLWNHVDVSNNSNVYSDLIPTGLTHLWDNFTRGTPIGGTMRHPTFYDDESKATKPPQLSRHFVTSIYDPVTSDVTVLRQEGLAFPFLHVYTGAAGSFGVQAVALEPMSGMADCFNNMNDLIVLNGFESWVGEFSVRLSD